MAAIKNDKKSKKQNKSKPFKLTIMDEYICFIGNTDVFRTAKNIKGAELRTSAKYGEYLRIPMSRENFMITESLANPDSISDSYIQARSQYMMADADELKRWLNLDLQLKRSMMPHQDNFCAQAYGLRGILNASEQGTGKTQMAIALHAAWRPNRSLIVCPKSLMYQWASEFAKVLYNPPIIIPLGGKISVAEKKDILQYMDVSNINSYEYNNTTIVINYEILAEMSNTITQYWKPDFVVFDESWKIKNPKAKVTLAAINVTDNVLEEGHILLLSGTPIGNDVGDLWSQMNIIRSDPDIEEYDEWMMRYAMFKKIQSGRGRLINIPIGCKNPAGLMKRISPQYFRATKASCLNLPDKSYDTVYFEMPELVKNLYIRVEEMGNEVFDPLSLSGERVTKLRLQQITGGCVPEIKDIQTGLKGATIIESPKREFVCDFAEDILKQNPEQRLIIWCKFNAEIEVLTAQLREILGDEAVFPVTRHTKDQELEDAKQEFNNRSLGVAQILVGQIKKLAYGHNLQSGDWNINFSHPWSYIDRSQLEDRTHRMGREGIVNYIDLVMLGYDVKDRVNGRRYVPSIDQEILDTIKRKGNLASRLGPDTVGSVYD